MHTYTYKKDKQIITVNHSLAAIKMKLPNSYINKGFEVVKIEFCGCIIFEK